MKSLIPALLSALLLVPAVAWADDSAQPSPKPEQGCGMADSAFVNQDGGQVTINCVGVTAEYGGQLAGILTYVLQHRLDPEIVVAKLDEIEGAPIDDAPRALSAGQGQTLVQSLVGKPTGQIAIVANPAAKDGGDYALAIATKLQMAGWQIAGSQIRRVVPPGLEEIHGLVLVVHDEKSPPDMALRLKQAMGSAKIFLPIISDPTLTPDAALLWIGKRPELSTATQ
jgi:hypothetical protein